MNHWRKVFAWTAGGILALVAIGAGAVFLIRHQITSSLAIHTPNGIDESRYVNIGGIPQWIRIRGQDKRNPIILFLHGGPGGAVLSASYQHFLGWERVFTVVHWDQRGSGRTYAANGYDAGGTTINRMALDGIEVAEHAKARLGKRKLILVGHSWGSHLGAHIVQRRPDLFAAYVAAGLWVNFRKSQASLYDAALAKAKTSSNSKAVRELQGIAQLSNDDLRRWKTILKWSAKEGDPGFPSDLGLFVATLFSPEYSASEALTYAKGFVLSTEWLGKEAMHDDLDSHTEPFRLPMFLIQGTQDGHVDPRLAVSYFEGIEAPMKQIVLFQEGGHYLHISHAAQFLRVLLQRVRPLAE